ncbi:MAG: transketolase [Butyrivibrio sp.]|nr:transketolase [Butyrivibrio sp.]
MIGEIVMIEKMKRLSADIRIQTIRAMQSAGFGHIGGSMSIADVLAVLYGGVMNIRPEDPQWAERDYLVLSKGHCGPALYAALALTGYFPLEQLCTLNQPGTKLPSHCDRLKTTGIDMSTGSLGQGVSVAAGIALGFKIGGKPNYIYCILGDGEVQEGQVWEAVEAAVHHKLDRLILFVDENKKQLDGRVADICDNQNLAGKFKEFGCRVQRVCGYDCGAIYEAVSKAKGGVNSVNVIILDTYKGIGCSFAESSEFNHYMVINKEMADEAVRIIEERYADGTYPGGDFV